MTMAATLDMGDVLALVVFLIAVVLATGLPVMTGWTLPTVVLLVVAVVLAATGLAFITGWTLTTVIVVVGALVVLVPSVMAVAGGLVPGGRIRLTRQDQGERPEQHRSHHERGEDATPFLHAEPHHTRPFIARWNRPVSPLATP